MLKDPFIKYEDQLKFICPYCHEGNIIYLEVESTGIIYGYNGSPSHGDISDVSKRYVCSNCERDVTHLVKFSPEIHSMLIYLGKPILAIDWDDWNVKNPFYDEE